MNFNNIICKYLSWLGNDDQDFLKFFIFIIPTIFIIVIILEVTKFKEGKE